MPASLQYQQKLIFIAALAMFLLISCGRSPEPKPFAVPETDQPLFKTQDLRKAKPAKHAGKSVLKGADRHLSVLEQEVFSDPLEAENSLSPQTVIASVDGWVVYIRSNGTTYQIYRHDQTNDARLLVYSGSDEIQSVAISSNGDHIVATIYDAVNANFEVYELVISSSSVTNLSNTATVDESNVSMSAAGNIIVWEGEEGGRRAPYLCFYTGLCKFIILSSSNNQVQPSISSNGEYLMLIEELSSGSDRIKMYVLDTETYIIVATSSLPLEHPSVNDNGVKVMYLQHDTTAGIDRIKIKDLSTGITVTERSATTPLFLDHPHITADGLYLSYGVESSTTGKLLAKTRDIASNLEGSTSNASYDHFGTFWQKPVSSYSRIYVDKDANGNNSGRDWNNAFIKLQDALNCARIDACPGGNQIWVASGAHYPDEGVFQIDNDEAATFELINGIYLAGGFDGVGAGGTGGAQETDYGQRNFDTNTTILSGDILQDDLNTDSNSIAETTADIVGDNSDHIVVVPYPTAAATVLDGFTITAGQADGSPFDGQRGGGVFCDTCNATLTNLFFQGNAAGSQGGALYNDYNSAPTLSSITFAGNSASYEGGAIYNDQARPVLTYVVFENNSVSDIFAKGGAIANYHSYPYLTDVAFENNTAYNGGAIYQNDGTLTLTNTVFLGNTATGGDGGAINNYYGTVTVTHTAFLGNDADYDGGAVYTNKTATFVNVIFSGNTARYGGAIYNWAISGAAHVTLLNVSMSRNSATSRGGAIYNQNSSSANITIKNSILWESRANGTDNEIYNEGGDIHIGYSNIKGGWNGAGVVNAVGGTTANDGGNRMTVPRFVDFDGSDGVVGTLDDNLRLRDSSYPSASPLIDRGTNNGITATTDLQGNPRIVDGDGNGIATVDMGAYEKQ